MNRNVLVGIGLAVALAARCVSAAEEAPHGKGMTDANKERLVLDDVEDVSDWYNGSPEETTLSANDRHVKEGRASLLFGNVVDHTKGEKNYPVGWPRTGKELGRAKLADWSGYDFFECWIYVDTTRSSLPKDPLSVGFYHSGPKRSSSFPLSEVAKGQWVKIAIPIPRLLDPKDVQRVQFSISESNYKHGDRVDFYIDDVALTRFVEPAVAALSLGRRLLFSHDRTLIAEYELVGYKNLDATKVELAIGPRDGPPAAKATGAAARRGEIALAIDRPLPPGDYVAALRLRDAQGKLIDRKCVDFRVIAGPFEKE